MRFIFLWSVELFPSFITLDEIFSKSKLDLLGQRKNDLDSAKMDLLEIKQRKVSDRGDVAQMTTNEDVGLKVIRKELLKAFKRNHSFIHNGFISRISKFQFSIIGQS